MHGRRGMHSHTALSDLLPVLLHLSTTDPNWVKWSAPAPCTGRGMKGGGQPSECFTAKRNGSFWWTSSVELEACFLRMRMRPKNTEPALYSLPICFSLWSHLFLYLYESTFPSSPRDSPFQQCVRVRAIIPVGGFRGKRGVFSLSFLISCLRHWLMHSRAGVKGPANSQTKGLGSRKKLLKKKL